MTLNDAECFITKKTKQNKNKKQKQNKKKKQTKPCLQQGNLGPPHPEMNK